LDLAQNQDKKSQELTITILTKMDQQEEIDATNQQLNEIFQNQDEEMKSPAIDFEAALKDRLENCRVYESSFKSLLVKKLEPTMTTTEDFSDTTSVRLVFGEFLHWNYFFKVYMMVIFHCGF